MSDIVERLRTASPYSDDGTMNNRAVNAMLGEAAAEIERMKEWQDRVLAAANCEGERIFQLGEDLTTAEQRVAELEAEIERLQEALKCIAVGMIQDDWVAGPRLSASMAVGRLSQIARDTLNQPRREEQQ